MATLVRDPKAAPPRPLAREPRLWDVTAVAAPAALAVALCLYELTTRSLWLDEAATVAIAGQHGSALWNAISHDGGNMLGYYALMHVLVGWFGHGALVIRLPSVVAAGAAAAAVSRWSSGARMHAATRRWSRWWPDRLRRSRRWSTRIPTRARGGGGSPMWC
jgi:hypothetical protein